MAKQQSNQGLVWLDRDGIVQPVLRRDAGSGDQQAARRCGLSRRGASDLQGGHIAAGCGSLTDFLDQHRQGVVKILVTGAVTPSAATPEIPTGKSLGHPSLLARGFFGFFAPPKTPTSTIDEWSREIFAAVNTSEVKMRLVNLGMDIETLPPADFRERITSDIKQFKQVMGAIGYKPT